TETSDGSSPRPPHSDGAARKCRARGHSPFLTLPYRRPMFAGGSHVGTTTGRSVPTGFLYRQSEKAHEAPLGSAAYRACPRHARADFGGGAGDHNLPSYRWRANPRVAARAELPNPFNPATVIPFTIGDPP